MIPPPTISPHGKAIARLLADWASPAPGVTIYFFGSRVRGDHGPASDVDVCIQFGQVGQTAIDWHTRNEEEDYATINRHLPSKLKILERNDPWWQRVVAAEVVHRDRNVCCVWLPPKL